MSRYSIDELVSLTALTKRTIRYYIQIGLLERPCGDRRAAYYLDSHLESLLRIKRLASEGFSLERIRALMSAGDQQPAPAPAPGTVSVRSHVYLCPGVELSVDPVRSTLGPEDLRRVIRAAVREIEDINTARNSKEKQ